MGNQASNSREKIKKMVLQKLREEEESRVSEILKDLASGKPSEEGLQVLVEEMSLLTVVSKSEAQIKTRCAKPNPGPLGCLQGIETHYFKSNPIRENDGEGFLKHFDEEIRTRFQNTSSFPQSVHGVVRADLGKGGYKTGTGILIGPNLVLTAAHNLYDFRNTKQKYSTVDFIPGMNEGVAPFGLFKVIESYVPEDYLRTWEKEDYALLVLDGVAGLHAGYFGLEFAEKGLLKGKELNVIGYPGYVRDEKNNLLLLHSTGRHQLWGMKGSSWLIDDDGKNGECLIQYPNDEIHTTPGQSGSGVFYNVEGTDEYYVIGVHVLGREGKGSLNSATWITKERFEQIATWVGQSRRKIVSHKIGPEGRGGELKIKSVNLSLRFIGNEGLEVLSEYLMPKLESLNLVGDDISNRGVRTLCENSNWPELKYLSLADNHVTEEGAALLGRSKCWTKLERLSLHNNQIKDAGASMLAENKTWTNLKQLILSSDEIGTKGANGLLRNKSWIRLEELSLRNNRIGGEIKINIEGNRNWENLKVLDLGSNRLSDRGVKSFARNSESWIKLETLRLDSNEITDKGAMEMVSIISQKWRNLKELHLLGNKIEEKDANAFKACWNSTDNSVMMIYNYKCGIEYYPSEFEQMFYSFEGWADRKIEGVRFQCSSPEYRKYEKTFCYSIPLMAYNAFVYFYDMTDPDIDLLEIKERISIYKKNMNPSRKLYLVGCGGWNFRQRSIFEEMKEYSDMIGAEFSAVDSPHAVRELLKKIAKEVLNQVNFIL